MEETHGLPDDPMVGKRRYPRMRVRRLVLGQVDRICWYSLSSSPNGDDSEPGVEEAHKTSSRRSTGEKNSSSTYLRTVEAYMK
jgi:hypothetical protein